MSGNNREFDCLKQFLSVLSVNLVFDSHFIKNSGANKKVYCPCNKIYKKWNDLSKTTEIMDETDECSIKNKCFTGLQGLRAHISGNKHAELHSAMKQYIEYVYSSRHIQILNEHVNFIFIKQRNCGYSIESEAVSNQSKKLFEIEGTNMSVSVFPDELNIDQHNRLFPNDKCGLKNNEDNVGKGGHKLNNRKLC